MAAPTADAATAPLRVLVVGNYPGDRQYSMQGFATKLVDNLRARGVAADLIVPPMVLGRIGTRVPRAAKWVGYVDKYLIFPTILRRRARAYDVVHIADHSNAPYQSARAGRPLLLTCHDLFAVRTMLGEIPHQQARRTGRWLQRWILNGLKRCPDIACVSEATADDVRRLVGADHAITHIPNALDPFFRVLPPAEVAAGLRAAGVDPATPFLLHVGGNQYYKNRPGVVRLFDALGTAPAFARHRLVLAGKQPDALLAAAIAASPVRDRILILPDPSDDTIRALYNGATALLFISLQEGFGWPLIEAQACGCPVVTTDADPMRSIVGADGAVLVPPDDAGRAADAVIAAVPRLPALAEAGRRNAERYAPDRIYDRYRALYAVLCARG